MFTIENISKRFFTLKTGFGEIYYILLGYTNNTKYLFNPVTST